MSSTAVTGPRAVSKMVVRCETFRRGSDIVLQRRAFVVLSEDRTHRIGDLADRCFHLDGSDDGADEVRPVRCRRYHGAERRPARLVAAAGTDCADAPDLPAFDV